MSDCAHSSFQEDISPSIDLLNRTDRQSLGKHTRDEDNLFSISIPLKDQPPKKRSKKNLKSKHWFFTWNGYPEEGVETLLAMNRLIKWVIQEEDAGTKHLQGLLTFTHEKSWKWMKDTIAPVHWERCRNLQGAIRYCQKQKTRAGGQWICGYLISHDKINVIDPLEGKVLFRYQKNVVKILKGPIHDRRIYWLWSEKGNIGKSALCKHLVLKLNAIVIGGTWKDAYYAIGKVLEKGKEPKIIIFDLPRSQQNKISYTGIEGIKNGLFFSPKYESTMVCFNIPHIIIFANVPPNQDQLSGDRWNIKCLDKEEDLKHIKNLNTTFNY